MKRISIVQTMKILPHIRGVIQGRKLLTYLDRKLRIAVVHCPSQGMWKVFCAVLVDDPHDLHAAHSRNEASRKKRPATVWEENSKAEDLDRGPKKRVGVRPDIH